jgi:hypothetical protein
MRKIIWGIKIVANWTFSAASTGFYALRPFGAWPPRLSARSSSIRAVRGKNLHPGPFPILAKYTILQTVKHEKAR